jgi:hypothetical protein
MKLKRLFVIVSIAILGSCRLGDLTNWDTFSSANKLPEDQRASIEELATGTKELTTALTEALLRAKQNGPLDLGLSDTGSLSDRIYDLLRNCDVETQGPSPYTFLELGLRSASVTLSGIACPVDLAIHFTLKTDVIYAPTYPGSHPTGDDVESGTFKPFQGTLDFKIKDFDSIRRLTDIEEIHIEAEGDAAAVHGVSAVANAKARGYIQSRTQGRVMLSGESQLNVLAPTLGAMYPTSAASSSVKLRFSDFDAEFAAKVHTSSDRISPQELELTLNGDALSRDELMAFLNDDTLATARSHDWPYTTNIYYRLRHALEPW